MRLVFLFIIYGYFDVLLTSIKTFGAFSILSRVLQKEIQISFSFYIEKVFS